MNQPKVAGATGETNDGAGEEIHGYASKLVSLQHALAMIRPGSRIFLGTGCAAPSDLLAGLEAMQPSPPDIEFVSFVTTSALPPTTCASHRHRSTSRSCLPMRHPTTTRPDEYRRHPSPSRLQARGQAGR
jgi:hypothetical protein